jgi:hypothetical protein
LSTTPQQPTNGSLTETEPPTYISVILKLFVKIIDKKTDINILDTGPACNKNINFFAKRGRMWVCDMLRLLAQDRIKRIPSAETLKHIDHPADHFDGILLWDLCDHLNDSDMETLIQKCYSMIKSDGLMVLCSSDRTSARPTLNTFVMNEKCEMALRPLPDIHLPFFFRQNRDMLKQLYPFIVEKSMIYRNGWREFLLKRKE